MSYQILGVQEAAELCLQPGIRILDCRDAHSYLQGHIPGAELVSDAVIRRLLRTERDLPILVYCYHGISSRDLAQLLSGTGFQSVYSLEGGWESWNAYREKAGTGISTGVQEWLKDQGFETGNLNSRIDNGMSSLMQAALLAETSYARELLQAGVDINLLNDDENNALWFACFSESLEIIDLLVSNGIDINNCNVNGATCLIYAASAGKYKVVKALVEAGANLQHQTLDGFTALDSASTIEVLRYLKQHCVAA